MLAQLFWAVFEHCFVHSVIVREEPSHFRTLESLAPRTGVSRSFSWGIQLSAFNKVPIMWRSCATETLQRMHVGKTHRKSHLHTMCTSCAHHVLTGSPSYSLWWTSRHRCHWKNNDTAQIQCQNGGWLCPLADCMNLRWIYMTAMVKAVSNQCIPLAAPLWSPYAWLRSCDIGCVFHHMSQL